MIRLTPPISDEDVKKLHVGDKVLITGTIYTARDQAHIRLIKDNNPNFELQGSVIFYVGPTPHKPNQVLGASGPTSSYRMDTMAPQLMARGVKLMIGKGDRSESFRNAMMQHNAVYLIATGGAGALLSSRIKKSKIIMYDDLGPEAIRELYVEDFPCFVAYDIYDKNIFKGDAR
ncbi:MAG: FumA C-terminus/TtdB family hydratase beta subunit [Candidatus Izimaplasma sp.]|nr:FumA C-terminus/TtdB family hydratase beta subunit [Candidatus Izimaplasma bacterium]